VSTFAKLSGPCRVGGLALGAAFGIQSPVCARDSACKQNLAYVGMEMFDLEIVDDLLEECNDVQLATVEALAELLAVEAKIVGVLRGRQEFGPRALGHRSLLADARTASTTTRLNLLKRRQWYRPVAPMLLLEDFDALFELSDRNSSSPFMARAPRLRAEARSMFPAISHVDGTARVQTVSSKDEPWIFELLHVVKGIIGRGVLANTSLNVRGEPILNDICTALRMLESEQHLDALVVDSFYVPKGSCIGNGGCPTKWAVASVF
jgi:carbamoyltransferase